MRSCQGSWPERILVVSNRKNPGRYENSQCRVMWDGFVYVDGKASGKEAIKAFADGVDLDNLAYKTHSLKGTFLLALCDLATNIWYVFTDNNGLYRTYYGFGKVSNSLLGFHGDCSPKDLDPKAIVEFFFLGGKGNRVSDRTLLSPVKKVRSDDILVLESNYRISLISKNLPGIDADLPVNFEKQMESFFASIAERNVSYDLTGGADTRLLVSLAERHSGDFHLAVSGRPDHPDVMMARRIAETLGKELLVTNHDLGESLEDELTEIFQLSTGALDILTYHRLHQLQRERVRRGIDLIITGEGGGCYEEYLWRQDFPFYHSRNVRYERILNWRLWPSRPNVPFLTEKLLQLKETVRAEVLDELKKYRLPTNTQSYDAIYYYFWDTQVGGQYLSTHSRFLDAYSPLLELQNVMYSYRLPRRRRFFHAFHRKAISKNCHKIAGFKSTQGVSMRDGKAATAKDLFGWSIHSGFRLVGKVLERVTGHSLPKKWPDNPNLIVMVRKTELFLNAVEELKKLGIVQEPVDADDIPGEHVGKVLTLGMLARELQ